MKHTEVMRVEVDLRGAELALLDALAGPKGHSREQALADALVTLAMERLCHYSNQVGGHPDEDGAELEAAAKGRMRRIVRALNSLTGPRFRVNGPYLQVHYPELRQWRRVFDYRWP